MLACGVAGVLSAVVTKARRSPWMNDRAELLVRLLQQRYGLVVDEGTARQDISDHVDHVATVMRVGRQAAKFYVTDEVIEAMAQRIAEEVARHQAIDLDAERRRRRNR
ncbi:hypothetical protein H7I77_09705 [Mycolicibacterium novocastrense]|uniref:Uncharacterized protein n=1 Tax=Mycolicibacterium novocastrense TaxID=59813 RepID=A0AAW5SHX8_MYCNV|nr:hypothetical protein [Mycolicibacterium novocastrense]